MRHVRFYWKWMYLSSNNYSHQILPFMFQIIPQEKRIYRLKDKHLERPVKGFLVITLDVIFNPVRASIRTFNPREPNALHEPPRFRRQVRIQNLLSIVISVIK